MYLLSKRMLPVAVVKVADTIDSGTRTLTRNLSTYMLVFWLKIDSFGLASILIVAPSSLMLNLLTMWNGRFTFRSLTQYSANLKFQNLKTSNIPIIHAFDVYFHMY